RRPTPNSPAPGASWRCARSRQGPRMRSTPLRIAWTRWSKPSPALATILGTISGSTATAPTRPDARLTHVAAREPPPAARAEKYSLLRHGYARVKNRVAGGEAHGKRIAAGETGIGRVVDPGRVAHLVDVDATVR